MEKYRIKEQIRGTVSGEFHRVIETIPEGSIVGLVGPLDNDAHQVEVLWNGRSFWLFEVDFRAQATGVMDESSPPRTKLLEEPPTQQPAVRVRRFNAAGKEQFNFQLLKRLDLSEVPR
jgi:hypothetical protein